jgi:hypothetical protein
MVYEYALVVDDVEIVDPNGKREIQVFSAGDLISLVPRSESSDQIRSHDVHHRAGRSRERRKCFHDVSRL